MQTQTIKSETLTDEREQLLTRLYKDGFPAVAAFVSRAGGSLEDAKDVFHDALVIYWEKRVEDKLNVHTSHKAYLLGISRFLYYRRCGKAPSVPFDFMDTAVPEVNEPVPSEKRLLRLVQVAGKKCMDLLTAFYYDKLPPSKLAQQFNYGSIRSATVQKYKCLEKLRETVKAKSIRYEDFFE